MLMTFIYKALISPQYFSASTVGLHRQVHPEGVPRRTLVATPALAFSGFEVNKAFSAVVKAEHYTH